MKPMDLNFLELIQKRVAMMAGITGLFNINLSSFVTRIESVLLYQQSRNYY